jgi:CheY-like chemotaxis protein
MRILVIESDPVTADVLEATFPNEHEVAVFGSAQGALERIAIGRPFDAVFCEVDPPDMTAKEVFERLEEGSPRTAQRLVFLVSELKTNRAFLERPAKRYLTRPITAAALRDALLALA